MQQAQYIGRVGSDAELRYTTSGKAVASFSMAIDNGKDKNNGTDRPPTWIKATLWEKRAEGLAQYITKGKLVYVSGRVGTEAWIDKNTQEARAKIVITVDNFEFCGGPRSDGDSEQRPNGATANEPQPNNAPISDDDIPF